MRLSPLAQSVTDLLAVAQADEDHFFKTDWVMLDMNLTAYETREKNLAKAMSEVRRKCGLKVTPANSETLNLHIKFLLLNFAQALRGKKPAALACPSSKQGILDLAAEDNPQKLTPTLGKVLEAMEKAGYVGKFSAQVHVRKSNKGGLKYNRFFSTPKLVTEVIEPYNLLRIAPQFIPSANFVVVTKKEIIRHGDEVKHELPTRGFIKPDEVKVIDESNDFLRLYNKLLRQTGITLAPREIEGNQSKTVYRAFCRGRLDCGGRLYGGFWQQLGSIKKGETPNRQDILLNGEKTVELDYKGLHINMLYAWKRMEPYAGDPYDLPDWPRELVKKCILIAINCKTKGHQAVLQAVKREPNLAPHYAKLLRGGYEKLKADFAAKHPAIASHLHADAGITLQFQDSQIAIRVIEQMMRLHEHGIAPEPIPVLCVHDSFIAPARWENELEMCMIGAYEWVMKTNTAPIIEKLG